MPVPSALADLYQLDSITEQYAAVAAHDGAYRRANVLAAAGAALGAVAAARLALWPPATSRTQRAAVLALIVATVGWIGIASLRVLIVIPLATKGGGSPSRNILADAVLKGDGALIAFSLLAGAALLTLAVTLYRAPTIGRPTVILVGIAGLATALLARSDPIAITFIPPFPYWLGFAPLGIALLRRNHPGSPTSPAGRPPARPERALRPGGRAGAGFWAAAAYGG